MKGILWDKMWLKKFYFRNKTAVTVQKKRMITLGEWERTVVCKQLTAARATSLLPFKMLFFTKRSKDSQPAKMKHDILLPGLIIKRTDQNYQIQSIQWGTYLTRNCLSIWEKERKNVVCVLFHPGPVQASLPTVSELCSDCKFIKHKNMLRGKRKKISNQD